MFNFDIFNQSKSLNVFNNLKVNKANNNLTSLINFSVIINVHEHPLQLCYPLARKNYGTGWTCDKCSTSFTYDEPSFYCTFCDLDICQKCIGEFRFNEINIYDTDYTLKGNAGKIHVITWVKDNFTFAVQSNEGFKTDIVVKMIKEIA